MITEADEHLLREELEILYVEVANLRARRLELEAELDWYRDHIGKRLRVPRYAPEVIDDPRAALRDYVQSPAFISGMQHVIRPLLASAAKPLPAPGGPVGQAFERVVGDDDADISARGAIHVASDGTGVLTCAERGLTYDFATLEASRDGESLRLTLTERALFVQLMRNPRRVVSRAELGTRIWGPIFPELDTRTIDAHIYRLRRKLGGGAIRSVPGIGYSLL